MIQPNTQSLNLSYKLKVSTLFAFCCTSSYLLINHLPLRTPILLWQSPIDVSLPFLAWTIWPYIILLFTDYFFPLMIVDSQHFRVTMRAYAITAAISFCFWALLPTTLPRFGFIPMGDSLSEQAYRLLIAMDPPNNCFPSGHISIPTVLFWALAKQWSRWRVLIWTLFAFLSLSILTTKQHYLLDLIGGLFAGYLGLKLSFFWTERQAHAAAKSSIP